MANNNGFVPIVWLLFVIVGFMVLTNYNQINKPLIPISPPSLLLQKSICESSGAGWTECGNKCMIDNQGKTNVACTQVCEQLCTCGGLSGMVCPKGYYCKMPNYPDATGYCVEVKK